MADEAAGLFGERLGLSPRRKLFLAFRAFAAFFVRHHPVASAEFITTLRRYQVFHGGVETFVNAATFSCIFKLPELARLRIIVTAANTAQRINTRVQVITTPRRRIAACSRVEWL